MSDSNKEQKIFYGSEAIVAGIKEIADQKSLLIVGVSGLGGSGKTTLCEEISRHFPDQVLERRRYRAVQAGRSRSL